MATTTATTTNVFPAVMADGITAHILWGTTEGKTLRMAGGLLAYNFETAEAAQAFAYKVAAGEVWVNAHIVTENGEEVVRADWA